MFLQHWHEAVVKTESRSLVSSELSLHDWGLLSKRFFQITDCLLQLLVLFKYVQCAFFKVQKLFYQLVVMLCKQFGNTCILLFDKDHSLIKNLGLDFSEFFVEPILNLFYFILKERLRLDSKLWSDPLIHRR